MELILDIVKTFFVFVSKHVQTHEDDSIFIECCSNQSPDFHFRWNDTNAYVTGIQRYTLISAPHYDGVMARFSSTPGTKLSK